MTLSWLAADRSQADKCMLCGREAATAFVCRFEVHEANLLLLFVITDAAEQLCLEQPLEVEEFEAAAVRVHHRLRAARGGEIVASDAVVR